MYLAIAHNLGKASLTGLIWSQNDIIYNCSLDALKKTACHCLQHLIIHGENIYLVS